MKSLKFVILFAFLAALIVAILYISPRMRGIFSRESEKSAQTSIQENIPAESKEVQPENNITNNSMEVAAPSTNENKKCAAPMDRAEKRILKKPFGIFITPQSSPVQPEKFRGYHTGTDFEIFSEELNENVSVKAICSGNIRLKKTASGYGGVAVQECEISGERVTVVYGHLDLRSIEVASGEKIEIGEVIGSLGASKSAQTDGERKHLHLSIHRGTGINLRGYVDSKSNLSDWIDPCSSGCCRQ